MHRARITVFTFLLVGLSWCTAWGETPAKNEYIKFYAGGYAFQYSLELVSSICPPAGAVTGDKGISLILDGGEKITSYWQAINLFAPPSKDGVWPEFKKDFDTFFIDKMRHCRKVPVEGYFELYYECADGLHAGITHPESGDPIYVDYYFEGSARNMPLYLQILRTFAIMTEEMDDITAVPYAENTISQDILLHCADLEYFEVASLRPTADWHSPETLFSVDAHLTGSGAAHFQQMLKESEGKPRLFQIESVELYEIFPRKSLTGVQMPYGLKQISLPEHYRTSQQAADLARQICPKVPVKLPVQ